MKDKLYYYRCTDPSRLDFYKVYDYARGLVAFEYKLHEKVREKYRLDFWGLWTEKEMLEGYAKRKVKAVGKQSKRQNSSESNGGRY